MMGAVVQFGNTLRRLRNHAGLTQAQLAARLGVTQSHIAHLEQAQRSSDTPSLDLVLHVARLFGVSIDTLLRPAWSGRLPNPPTLYPVDLPIAIPQQTGAKIRWLRELHQIRQIDLALDLGLQTQGTLANIEANRRRASLEVLIAAADIFNVTIAWLVDDSHPIDAPMYAQTPPDSTV